MQHDRRINAPTIWARYGRRKADIEASANPLHGMRQHDIDKGNGYQPQPLDCENEKDAPKNTE